MISRPIAASVPIVSQTEIDPMKTAFSRVLALVTTTTVVELLPVPKPRGPGGSCPHGYIASGSFCTASSAIARRRTAHAHGDGSRAGAIACATARG